MSSLTKITIASLLATALSSGCCLTSSCLTTNCGVAGGSCGTAGCGAPGLAEPGCGLPAGGCDSCAGGAQCGDAGCGPGACLGLGCIGKLFSISSYGCTGCASGCGGNYYHDWISDPPCADPCDGCGSYSGISGSGVCGSCTGGSVAASCGAPEPSCGLAVAEPTCGIAEPTCGVASCDRSCGSGGGGLLGAHSSRGGFKIPGRVIYSTLGGVGGIFRELRRGLLPSHGSCNAFTSYTGYGDCGSCGSCDSCVTVEPGCGVEAAPSCGCVGATHSHPTTTHVVSSPARTVSSRVANARVPHDVVTRSMRTAHKRSPHKVVSKHMR